MNLALFQRALELEEVQPQRALTFYDRLGRENKDSYPDILLIAIVCPILASVVAFFASRVLEQHQSLVTVLILAGLGFTPAWVTFQNRVLQSWPERVSGLARALAIVVPVFGTLLSDALTLFFVFLLAGVLSAVILVPVSFLRHLLTDAPFLPPAQLPLHIYLPVFVPAFLFALALALSEVRFPRFFRMPLEIFRASLSDKKRWFAHSLKRLVAEIPVGLRLNVSNILQFLASLGMGAVLVGAGPLGLLYDHLYRALLASGLAGGLLGLSIYRVERDLLLGNFIRLGQVRCLIRLGRMAEADYRLVQVFELPGFSRPEAVEDLASALSEMLSGGQPGAPQPRRLAAQRRVLMLLQTAAEAGRRMDRYRDIWLASFRRTWSLAGLGEWETSG
ncbi:MAG TPA: hypothetical protein ENI37_07590 [Chloroflexi bacterium]|nr:hypothetical protein [Chloroflexota bacterium]